MSPNPGLRRAAIAVVLATAALAGCGKQGALEQPAPLFGGRAKAEYDAQRAQEARDDAQRASQAPIARSDATSADNAPPSTRNVLDPAQKLSPASSNPVSGASNPLGAPVQPRP